METENNNTKILKDEFITTSEFCSQVIDSLQDYAILTIDKELFIKSWSAGASKIFGYEKEEVIGEHFELIFTEEDKNKGLHKVEIENALTKGKAVDNKWHLRKDGSTFYAYGLVFTLIGKDGELLGYVKILRDLTERKKSEEAIQKYIKDLEELNTHKENILAILSHDLRSPLIGIIQMAEVLKEDFKSMGDEKLKSMLDTQYELSTNELSMLDYLLEWARIKYASEAFAPTQIDLRQKVNKVFDILREAAAVNSIQLLNRVKENTIVFADKKMVLSILQNMVSNAIGHSSPSESITVTAREIDHMVLVQVKDTGFGMSQQTQEKLFIPQMKTLLKSRDEEKGGGIGLLLAKALIEKNGGEICFESIEGEGTSFYFTMPTEKPMENDKSAAKMEFEDSA